MRQMDKNPGRHRLTADATLPDRRDACRAPPGHVACVINTSNSSMAREPPWVFGMAVQRF